MDRFLDLKDIVLLPVESNAGGIIRNKATLKVIDSKDVTGPRPCYPIFTSPMESIIGKENFRIWTDYGIRTIIPRTTDIESRLSLCQWIFCAFSIPEVIKYFLNQSMKGVRNQLHVCIDSGNGHDMGLLDVCRKLKAFYGNQILIMAGNVANPRTYVLYSKAGIDYMRVGISNGSLVNREQYGFYYPMAQFLMDLTLFRNSGACAGLRPVKIIADGGIEDYSDIMKAIALGADYVMIGMEFARVVEALGTVIKVDKDINGVSNTINIDPQTLIGMSGVRARSNDFYRYYYGNTTEEMQARRAGFNSIEEWKKSNPKPKIPDAGWRKVKVDINLKEWIEEFEDVATQGFVWANATNWKEYKEHMYNHYGTLR